MEKLVFDLGIKAYEINDSGAVLRFNPSDINLYHRFTQTTSEIEAIGERVDAAEQEIAALPEEEQAPKKLEVLNLFDREVKEKLNRVFGLDNDFEVIFAGINVLSVSGGERILTNFLAAIRPIIEAGAAAHNTTQAQQLAQESRQNRAQRRASV